MGVEYSRTNKNTAVGRHLLYDIYGARHQRTSGNRCLKCSGHGRLYTETQCDRCPRDDRTLWSNYSESCSCNGYGRQTVTELCDDCHGRGTL